MTLIEEFDGSTNGSSDELSDGEPIGRVKAPRGTAGYSFITTDTDRVKIGEFVYYRIMDDSGSKRSVLGRTTSRESVREFPDSYLSLIDVSPTEILQTTGVSSFTPMFEVEVSVIGYFDPIFKFVNPRVPPLQGSEIFLASDDFLKQVLGGGGREEGKALMGHLLNRPGDRVPITMDVGEVVSKHLAVLAATGSGKSYAVGVLLEELMGTYNRAAVLVLDPHGEYHTMDGLRNLKKQGSNPLFDDGLASTETRNLTGGYASDGEYIPDVRILSERDIKIRYSDLEAPDWYGILKDASDKMLNLLHEANQRLKKGGRFGFADIVNELESMREESNTMSIDGLSWRLRAHAKGSIFSSGEYTPLTEILRPGQLTIIDMSELEEGHQQLIASILLRRILQARIRTKKDKESEGEYHLPYPVFIVLEESHRFAPASGESRSKKVLKTILSEGRKFGVGTCLVTQRPGKLDSDVLSQCMTQIIMKIINPSDQENIKQSVEAVTADLLAELPSLTTGQAVVVGAAINTPVTIGIRERYTKPGGSGSNAPREWRNYHEEVMEREQRDAAPVSRQRDRGLF